jgi:hypothetical protein
MSDKPLMSADDQLRMFARTLTDMLDRFHAIEQRMARIEALTGIRTGNMANTRPTDSEPATIIDEMKPR